MIRPLPLYIGLRYIRAKRRNQFISFISFASTIGIALGVMVLITVLSVMNGFDEQIKNHFFALAPQVTVSTEEDLAQSWPQWLDRFKTIPQVKAGAPFVGGEGILISGNHLQGVNLVGILPDQEVSVSKINQAIIEGNLTNLIPDSFQIVIGQSLAEQLDLNVGDPVNVLTSQTTTTPLGLFPRYRSFKVSGIFTDTSNGFGLAKVYIAMSDAEKLLAAGVHRSGLHIKLSDWSEAPAVRSKIQHLSPAGFTVTDWTQESGAFFQALAMEKIMMFIILLLIIGIAAFNLVSMLVMLVSEKQADIAILRTLGATPAMIRNIFITQGSLLGLIGMLGGLILGLILTVNITPVVNALQSWFHVQFIPTTAYWSNFLPHKIIASDVIGVCLIAFVLSVLATLYPAWMAFRIQPAEALRYE